MLIDRPKSLWGTSKSTEDTLRFCGAITGKQQLAFAVLLKADDRKSVGKFVGFITIGPGNAKNRRYMPMLEPETTLVELGYQYLPQSWGNGYATEALTAALAYFKGTRGLLPPKTSVVAMAKVHPDNIESIRVLEKVGMKRGEIEPSDPAEEKDTIFYNGAWRKNEMVWYYRKIIDLGGSTD